LKVQLDPGESLIVELSPSRAPAPWQYRNRVDDAQPLKGRWNVTFLEGGPELPPSPYEMDTLVSWTEQGDKATTFAGTARYRIEFDHAPFANAADYLLDLGDVRESARVILNGKPSPRFGASRSASLSAST
jgi:hypothetical protein